jgi:hypothetical protein
MPQQRQTEVISIGGREVTVPVGMTPAQIKALAKQMNSPAVEVGGTPTEFEDVMIGDHLVKAPVNATPDQIKALAAELKRNPPKEDTFIGGGTVTDTHRASEGALPDNAPAWQKGLSGAWEYMNPLPMFKALGDPIGTIKDIGLAQWDQAKKAYAAEQRQRTEPLFGGMIPLSRIEAMGHLGAAALPIVGPAAANIGETFGRGEFARGTGQLGGLLIGGKMVEAAPRAVLKVAKGAAGPSTRVAARNAAIATQDAAEGVARQKWEANAAAEKALYDAKAEAIRQGDTAKAARLQAVHDAKVRAQATSTGAAAGETATAAEAHVDRAKQVHEAKRKVHEAAEDAKAEAHRAKYDAAKAAHEAALDARDAAAKQMHDAERAVYDAETTVKHQQAVDQHAAKKAAYDKATDIENATRRAEYDARKAAHDATTANKQAAAAQTHEAKLSAADETAAATEQWVKDRQAAADAHAELVQKAVTEKLGEMEPTNIVTDRLKAARGEAAPAALPESPAPWWPPPLAERAATTGGAALETTQFQLPSLATRTAADTAAKLRLMRQTGMEVPRPTGGPVVPDLPLRPTPTIAGHVPPGASVYPEFVPSGRAPYPDLVPPVRAPFGEHVPGPRNPFADYTKPARTPYPDFVPPQYAPGIGGAARAPIADFVPPSPTPIPDYVPPPDFVPPPREVFPPVRGPKTRAGELAWTGAKYGTGAYLGYEVSQLLKDAFLK